MITVAIGDIHGCLAELEALLAKVDKTYPLNTVKLVFLGDYVDRGPDSKGVIRAVRDLITEYPDTIALRGNHEDMMVSPEHIGSWMRNGGAQTIASYGGNPYDFDSAIEQNIDFAADCRWIRFNLPYSYDDGIRFFCHAGVMPGVPLQQQRPEDLMWIRQTFLHHKEKFERYIVHGHTPLYDHATIYENRCNLDSACVFGGVLTAAVFNDEIDTPIEIITVPGYQK